MTTTKTTAELFADMLLTYRWNCTYQEASIAKVLAHLSDGTFFDKIESEELNDYNANFKCAYQAWRKTDSRCNLSVLNNALRILQNSKYLSLVQNFNILAQHGIASEIRNWCYGTSTIGGVLSLEPDRLIKAIHSISTFAIIERHDGIFQHNHYVFNTLDEAIIRAIAVKYDGTNTEANHFICKMLSVSDQPKID